MTDSLKIATVVVTYNRLELLKECIDSLRKQTRKIDEIFVINNSSIDGTEEWLSKEKDLTTITQPNSGGAGGFYTGIKTAYDKGYDWIWVMDDDGLPLKNALEELLKRANSTVGVINSLVVSKSNQNELSFGLGDYKLNKLYIIFEQVANREFVNGANFFNGTMIARETISRVGFPNPLFFIYGDELDYYSRIRYLGITIITIPTSVLKHPNQNHRYIGKWKFFYRLISFNSLGVKYFPRNIMAIWYFDDEFTFRRLLKTYFYDISGILFLQRNISFVFIYLYSIFTGISFIRKLNKTKQYS